MNSSIIALMSDWMRNIKNKRKLIIISLDNKQNAKSTSPNNTYLFEFEIKPLTIDYSKKLIKKITKKLPISEIDKIAKISEGNPENIKYVCDKYVKSPEGIQVTERIDVELRMRSEARSEFFKLCVLSIVNGVIPKSFVKDNELYDVLSVTKKIYRDNDNIYVSEWLLNALLISGKYNIDLIEALDNLKKLRRLNNDKYLFAKAVILKIPADILTVLKTLDKKQDYKLIKYLYLKTFFALNNYYGHIKKQIAAIFIKALLQLGEYDLVSEAFTKIDAHLLNNDDNDFEINYLLADFYHLTSDYKKSNDLFESLIKFAKTSDDTLKLRFNLAHNNRHSGDVFNAYKEFESIKKEAEENSDIYVRSVTAMVSINYFINGYDESLITELEKVVNNSNVKFNVYRHLISLYRRNIDKIDYAINLCHEKLEELNLLNLRIIHDYYFELAECYRLKYVNGDSFAYSEALKYYNKALIFSEMNSDTNLRLNSIIGKALLEYCKTQNGKSLCKQMEKIIVESEKVSSLIYGSVLTVLGVVNNFKDCEYLKKEQFEYYYRVFKSKDVQSFILTVM